MSTVNVRVRGIYATAISKILYDKGFNICHASKKIKERFGLKETLTPPNVTVKGLEHRQGVLIIGDYDEAKAVYNVLKEVIKPPITYVSKLPFHGIVKGEVVEVKNDVSIVDLGISGIKGVLREHLNVGDEVVVDISRPLLPPNNIAVLSRNYMIHGKYVVLIHGRSGRVFFSEHITDPKLRRNLKTLASLMKIEGNWGIKWRSAATIGKVDELMLDLQNTVKYANEILSKFDKAKKGELIYAGQFFGIMVFSSENKNRLDEIRSKVYPTVKGHHKYKSLSDELTEIVDYSEYMLLSKPEMADDISEILLRYVYEKAKEKTRIEIEHVSILDNTIKKLTPGQIIKLTVEDNEAYVTVKRVFRSKGVYDGLGVEKEPGDYDLMEFSTKYPVIIHKYFSKNGEFKGIYLNINSPPEIVPGKIRYIDYEVDVVATKNEVREIDVEKLEKAVKEGILEPSEAEEKLEIARKTSKLLKENIEKLEKISIKDLEQVLSKES